MLAMTAAAAAVLLFVSSRRNRGGKRRRAIAALLDVADRLEARLRTAREAIGTDGDGDGDADPIRDAMQEMLRQRLWLQQHGNDASLAQLYRVRDSIDSAHRRIDQQLVRVERAHAPQP